MPACECHAAALVLGSIVRCKRLVTDCLSNVKLAQAGGGKAKSAGHPYARAWHAFFAAADGWDLEEFAETFVWMPSHKTIAGFSNYIKSNGEAVSIVDWLGNWAADKLAEVAAMAHRLPYFERMRRAQVTEALSSGLAKAGRITHHSQNGGGGGE